ncbi:uncharacterized protein LOC106666460 isoform X2 [Cimex lectularius]|nr:uncharacterized protein LOC106666460 isoform X2 [Cimex lectularius]XP_024084860.1 uncharacterized protein LOC106666460 isoform X2 [Cimex lectularius]
MNRTGEMGGVELVCRLVAATPPYLYSPAGPPHSYFFSELLRGLVAKRCASPPSPDSSKRIRLMSRGSAFVAPSIGTSVTPVRPANQLAPTTNPLATSYILPRLKDVYTKVTEEKKQKEPLPAVIGLELVVDYVKHEKEPAKH